MTLTLGLLVLVVACTSTDQALVGRGWRGHRLGRADPPIGQAVVPIALGLPFLLALPGLEGGPTATRRWSGSGLALVLAPWTIRNLVLHGTPGADGALGQALIGRTCATTAASATTTRPVPTPTRRAPARRIIQQESATSPRAARSPARVATSWD